MIDKDFNNIEITCLKCVQREVERDQARKVGQRLKKALTGEEPLYADWLQSILQENPWLQENNQ